MKADVQVSRQGTLFLFNPLTPGAQTWLETRTDGLWYGGALVVENRYARYLAQAMLDEGFKVI